MPVNKNYEQELELMRGLKALTSAYEEISVLRIGKVRDKVLATRSFRDGLFGVFSEVRLSRKTELERLIVKTRGEKSRPFGSKRNKIAVLLSTDERLSGGIASSVIRRFVEHLDKNKGVKAVIIGLVGKQNIEKSRPDIKFKYFRLPGMHASLTEHKELVSYLRNYDDVSIFYGKFVNVVDQVATTTQLVSDERLSALPKAERKKEEGKHQYLFEPELPQVLDFFDTQVFAMLFGQTINESSLAQLGSRITAMEIASSNIENKYEQLIVNQRRAIRDDRNKKQRQMLSGISLWS